MPSPPRGPLRPGAGCLPLISGVPLSALFGSMSAMMLIYKSFSVKEKAFAEAMDRLIVRITKKFHQFTLLVRRKTDSAAGH